MPFGRPQQAGAEEASSKGVDSIQGIAAGLKFVAGLGRKFTKQQDERRTARKKFLLAMKAHFESAQCADVLRIPMVQQSYTRLKHVQVAAFHARAAEYGIMTVSYDFDKANYVDALARHCEEAVRAYLAKDVDGYTQAMTYLAYLGLIKREHWLVLKIYNLMGHTFKTWKQLEASYQYFKRLRDTSRMAGDVETTMYAFKQIGFVLLQKNECKKARKAFKCQLQVAWHLNHYHGELSAYENIATAYFYLGNLDKCEYYWDRKLRGKSEATFSAQKQISLSFTRRRYVGHIAALKAEGIRTKGDGYSHCRDMFSRHVKNYSLADATTLRDMGIVTQQKWAGAARVPQLQLTDATGPHIEPGSAISDMSERNLPSPSEVKGQAHILLLPFYQEITKQEHALM
jgi:tetratricopeptide (TPR) repeat protein